MVVLSLHDSLVTYPGCTPPLPCYGPPTALNGMDVSKSRVPCWNLHCRYFVAISVYFSLEALSGFTRLWFKWCVKL